MLFYIYSVLRTFACNKNKQFKTNQKILALESSTLVSLARVYFVYITNRFLLVFESVGTKSVDHINQATAETDWLESQS